MSLPALDNLLRIGQLKAEPRNDAEPMSSLTLIWFQDEFALPVDAKVLAHIQSLDWDALATECCW